jgi:hypothetical protein
LGNEQVEHVEAVPVTSNAIEVMERATIDIQIATAHAYPRSISAFTKRAKEMVAVDAETAESCIYRRPVGKDAQGNQTYTEGESIRLAEIVAASYGNLRASAMVVEMTPKYVKAVGAAHDLESNYSAKAEVVESCVKKNGQPYDERMRVVVAKAAQSKAMRDAIFRVVPKSLCKSITNLARQVIAGDERPLEQRREMVRQWLSKLSIDGARVFAVLKVKGIEDLGNDELLELTGIRTALKDGDITLDEAFPPIVDPNEGNNAPGTEGVKDRIKGKTKKVEPPKDEPASDPPTELRFYCQGCDKEFSEPNDKGLCPHCFSKKIIDRQKGQ